MGNRPWTVEEETALVDKWGTYSIPTIAKSLDRSVNAIKVRASRLGIGPVLMGGDYVTLHQLLIAVNGGNSGYGYKLKSWVENRGLPVHKKQVVKCSFRVVYLAEFWEWAEKNRSFLDLSKMEPLALGKEPAWVANQRKKDAESFRLQRKDPWTAEDDSRLKMLLKEYRYGYAEMSAMLYRSEGAIQRRCIDLGIKERPVRASNRTAGNDWTDQDFQKLAEGIRNGDGYAMIGREVNRSEKAVRGKVYFVYLTESADKVRAMMGDGPWGYGAPEPTVKQAVNLSRCRTETQQELDMLVYALQCRAHQLCVEDGVFGFYFQRTVCAKWSDAKGCTAGCNDCDSCSEFQRIRPQYCARCGKTFMERAENRFCPACRVTRLKDAQRKYAKLHAKRG